MMAPRNLMRPINLCGVVHFIQLNQHQAGSRMANPSLLLNVALA